MRIAFVSLAMIGTGLLLPALVPGEEQPPPAAGANVANPAAPANADVAAANSFRGRLPPNYGKVGVDAVQKAKIYQIQGKFAVQIDALEAQLAQLKTQRDAEVRAVLTAAQQKQLDEITGAKKTAKALVDAKMLVPPAGNPAQPAANNPAQPAANNPAQPAMNNPAQAAPANAIAGAKADAKAAPGKAAMKPAAAKGAAKAAAAAEKEVKDAAEKDEQAAAPQEADAKEKNADKSAK